MGSFIGPQGVEVSCEGRDFKRFQETNDGVLRCLEHRGQDVGYGERPEERPFLRVAKNRRALRRPKYKKFVVLYPWRRICRASAPAHDAK